MAGHGSAWACMGRHARAWQSCHLSRCYLSRCYLFRCYLSRRALRIATPCCRLHRIILRHVRHFGRALSTTGAASAADSGCHSPSSDADSGGITPPASGARYCTSLRSTRGMKGAAPGRALLCPTLRALLCPTLRASGWLLMTPSGSTPPHSLNNRFQSPRSHSSPPRSPRSLRSNSPRSITPSWLLSSASKSAPGS